MNIWSEYDIIILGAGISGLTLTALLSDLSLNIAVIDCKDEPKNQLDLLSNQYDARVSAINTASQKIFQKCGVWENILDQRASIYKHMQIFEEKNAGVLNFDCKALNEPSLGYIIENSVMLSALYKKLNHRTNVTFYFNQTPEKFLIQGSHAELFCQERCFKARLMVGADGGNSWLRQQCQISTHIQSYEQHALVATIKTEYPHQKTAYQRFLSESILAFLPLADAYYSSIVWSLPTSEAKAMQALEKNQFEKVLESAFDYRLGMLSLASERFLFPLQQQHANRYIQERVALIADAIHTIHPLAGQGLNLGLQDVVVLHQTISHALELRRDIGHVAILRAYERARRLDNLVTGWSMDIFKTFFSYQDSKLSLLQEKALHFVEKQWLIKKFFAQRAMGKRYFIF